MSRREAGKAVQLDVDFRKQKERICILPFFFVLFTFLFSLSLTSLPLPRKSLYRDRYAMPPFVPNL